jgi:hypothetical protein
MKPEVCIQAIEGGEVIMASQTYVAVLADSAPTEAFPGGPIPTRIGDPAVFVGILAGLLTRRAAEAVEGTRAPRLP